MALISAADKAGALSGILLVVRVAIDAYKRLDVAGIAAIPELTKLSRVDKLGALPPAL